MNENRDSEAMVEFEKSISLKPDYSHPYHNIGHMLAVRGRYAEALPFYLKAISLNAYEWKTRQDIGQVYFMLKKYPEAKEQLTRAIEQGSPEVERLQTILNRIRELGF
jgi:tetratricopeptide (TPR) repeat protein